MSLDLASRLIAVHAALARADVPHAFGGAIALGYWVDDPRTTSDIDVNVFAPAARADEVLAALPDGVEVDQRARDLLARDEQVRVFWDATPIDLFFDYAPVHADAARNCRIVRFRDVPVPILAAHELAVFKAMFDRPKDWIDIAAMVEAGNADPAAIRRTVLEMVGPEDARVVKLDELFGVDPA